MWPFTSTQPETVSTDTIIPLHWNDDTIILRSYVLDFMLRFDDVLESGKLCAALTKLMTIGDWKKLGARMRLNNTGKLEYHVPASYSPERPGFDFSHVEYHTSIELDPLASRLPRASKSLSVHPNPREFTSLARRTGSPIKWRDYICADVPQLSLFIVSFTDATLVTLSFPHTFSDAMGAAALFSAWVLVLNGKESEVLPLAGFTSDPLATLGSTPTENFSISDRQLKGVTLAFFVARYVFELLWYPKEEGRVIFIPAATLARIKAEAIADIEVEHKISFLSDGDIIAAWWSKLVLKEMPWVWNRTISLFNAFNWRDVLSTSLLPKETAYVSNAVGGIYALFPCREILDKPTASTAAAVRRAIIDQGTLSQVDAFAAIYKAGIPLFGDSSTFVIAYSNWKKAGFYEIDFSAAVVKEGIPVGGRAHKRGRPSYMHGVTQVERYPTRNIFTVFGKDAQGNYWMGGTLRAGIWAKLEEALKDF